MNTLRWKLNRLQTMGLPEIVYRIRQMLKAKLEVYGIRHIRVGNPLGPCPQIGWLDKAPSNISPQPYLMAANQILAGHWDVFSLRQLALGFPPAWNRDPKSGREAPMIFGKMLDYRDEALVGDIKSLWEPNRHQELVTLAQAFLLSQELRYAEACRTLLLSWIEQCPYPLGPNWTSSLEHAIRLTNWAVTWQLLGGERNPLFASEAGAEFRQRWLESIHLHCRFIAGHLSRYSSANNHLFGEYMGLFVAALSWPCWKESAHWRDQAMVGLENEARKQNAPDGVNREQATWYHHEVADMMLLCGLLGRASGYDFSARYWMRLEAMLTFIASIMNVAGQVPMIGDADDAVMVRFSREADFNPYRSLLATGAVLFERADFAVKAQYYDDKTRWLLGDVGNERFVQLQQLRNDRPASRRSYTEGGYYILGDHFDTSEEIRLIVDAGPTGYLSIAAHGHADALAITLSVGGNEFLIDPGTYAYHTEKKWREYFRGTSAHNTIRVDTEDQSISGGNFMWLHKANAWCDRWETVGAIQRFAGEHDGYRRFKDGVTHRREIEFDCQARRVRITDRIICRGVHEVEGFWHFSEKCAVTRNGYVISAINQQQSLHLTLPQPLDEVFITCGDELRPAGWVSRAFNVKTPAPTVGWRKRIEGEVCFETNIAID